jgi:hypothetical protein
MTGSSDEIITTGRGALQTRTPRAQTHRGGIHIGDNGASPGMRNSSQLTCAGRPDPGPSAAVRVARQQPTVFGEKEDTR